MVKYNEHVFSQIRRFVVVQEKRAFCYAWLVVVYVAIVIKLTYLSPIYTYGGRGTSKAGVDPDEHAIVYSLPQPPQHVPGETRLTKGPIRVIPASPEIKFSLASRINFAINHPIQHNVKVKDLGMVADEDMPKLIGYWRLVRDTDPEVYDGGSKRKKVQPSPNEVLPRKLGREGEWDFRLSTEPTGVGGKPLVEPMSRPPALGSQTLHTPHVTSSRTLTSTNMAGENEDSAALEGIQYSEATTVPGRLDSRMLSLRFHLFLNAYKSKVSFILPIREAISRKGKCSWCSGQNREGPRVSQIWTSSRVNGAVSKPFAKFAVFVSSAENQRTAYVFLLALTLGMPPLSQASLYKIMPSSLL